MVHDLAAYPDCSGVERRQPMSPKHCIWHRALYVRSFTTHLMGGGNPSMSDNPPLLRQWLLLKTLSARHHGATVAEMATELSVTEKTVRRDLKAFCDVGFPIVETVGDHGRKAWRVTPAFWTRLPRGSASRASTTSSRQLGRSSSPGIEFTGLPCRRR
jgi:hypothetical protein